ncbi:hypothetical protein DY000_02053990 [Brassica cretica]|uniref:Transmembrane protein n=1 Tax=Brassica cretica TaxID=69181 RepID=A0ABQ7AA07_BRACR|nr:hypothetical protein DY000_02053990 [Brassica cretica]
MTARGRRFDTLSAGCYLRWPSGSTEGILTHDCQRSRVRHSVGGVVLKPLQKNLRGFPGCGAFRGGPPCFSGGRSAVRGRRIPSFLLLSPIVCVPSVLLSFVSLLSAAGGAPPQLRSGILGFRSEVSGGESRRVRVSLLWFSPLVSCLEFRWFWCCLVCALGLLISAHSWVIGCPSGNGVWELVRN